MCNKNITLFVIRKEGASYDKKMFRSQSGLNKYVQENKITDFKVEKMQL